MLIESALAAAIAITPAGVGDVKLGKTFNELRQANLIGGLRNGCELSGPNTKFASLRAPLKGTVDLTKTSPRKVARITITGKGATARGVGIGSSATTLKRKFPKAKAEHASEEIFGVTLYKVPSTGGGRMWFAVDVSTKKVTLIGVPNLSFCD
jgi:hypothetical protein